MGASVAGHTSPDLRTAAIRIKTKSGTMLGLLRARYKPGPMLHKLAAGFEMIGAQIGRV